jgi:hypothetical protein
MNASYILRQLANFCLYLRLDVIGGLMGAFIGGVAVSTVSADWLGLALSYNIEEDIFEACRQKDCNR